ncbi:SDR family NAD(P)-dependent oxidoreductase [Paenibacillus sp. GCM10023248]|uniref:SDR family NAD(P)-dependent oxidoreductase n=1 Tax=unclassified Paenibacillus TaxID=185978 RepID=UPI002378922E|nr:SDR family NAD(P)-dependent oxidoreductase [Paenibacillus sp. MAHUQ-63]MDD9270479.1 SDR family NAD(P)-dependent oxidoreductase [Paenibacillus sp. MAHUQ-63]
MRLKEKVTLITGGAHGIGRAISRRFAREGAKVAIADNEAEALEEAGGLLRAEGAEVLAVVTDVQCKSQIDAMIDQVTARWGRLDVVVNNAGICRPSRFLEMTEEDWDRHMNVNLKGAFLVSQRAAKEMVRQGAGGSIIQMSSVNGLAAESEQAHYNASKGGLNLLMMSMALELAEHGIRVNSLCPGFIETRLTQPLIDNPQAIGNYVMSIPMRKVGQPEDIADAALFMASDESRYMTGHCMVIDGGQIIKLS